MSPSDAQMDLAKRLVIEKLSEDKQQEALDWFAGVSKAAASVGIEKLMAMPTILVPGSDLDIAITWLRGRSRPSDFEKGLLEQYDQRGSLSPKQIAVCVERANKTTTTAQPGQTTVSALNVDVPAGRYAVKLDGDWRLFRVWRGTRNPNVVHVYEVKGTEKGERSDGATEARALAEIAKDLLAAAVAFGHHTGSCGKCGLTLDNNLTRYMGIGPVCIKAVADNTMRLTLIGEARDALRSKGIDPAGSNDDLSVMYGVSA